MRSSLQFPRTSRTLAWAGLLVGVCACVAHRAPTTKPAAGAPPPPAAAPQAPAEERSVRPGVNDRYFEDGALERWTGVFEGESREVARERDRIVDALALEPGMAVGDIGAGTGLFTLELAERVGETGKVYAVDIVPEFLTRIRERARAAGARNVETVLGEELTTGLPDGSLDVAFLCNVYHHLEFPRSYLASVARALRPGGVMVVIDFERIEGKTSPRMLEHVRAGKPVVLEEIRRAGFALTAEHDFLRENYFLVFRPSR